MLTGEKAIEEINDYGHDFTGLVIEKDFIRFSATSEYINKVGDKSVIVGHWYFSESSTDKVDTPGLFNWGEAEDYEIVG